MSRKGKEAMPPTQSRKRGYVAWNKEMDEILISVFKDQIKEGNKGDGEWKPQAYQAVADALNSKLGLLVNVDHVRNRIKVWKRHYAVISDIRQFTKFKWDDEKKIVVVTIEDMTTWLEYTKDHPTATSYANKSIKHWDDIIVLVGPDRALGDGAEQHEEGFNAMDEDGGDGESSSTVGTVSSGSGKKLKRDRLADAVTCFADSFKDFVECKRSEAPPKPTGKEVHEVVSKVYGILRHQVLRATKKFMSLPNEFQMLKDLHEDEKLDWVILCLGD